MKLLPLYRIFFLLVLILSAQEVTAQPRMTLVGLDVSEHPTVRARFYASDAEGKPITDFFLEDFNITENGVRRPATSIQCPPETPPRRISSVLTMDVSLSMNAGSRMDVARAAAAAWINGMPLGYSECAVSSFDDGNYLNQDFTTDRQQLLDAVAALQPQGGTNYNAGLYWEPTAGVPVAKGGAYKRVVIFLTDGIGAGNEEAIVQEALANDVTVYCVVLGMPAPDVLKNIAVRTGGFWFENVETAFEAEDIYKLILKEVQGEEACVLEWESSTDCQPLRDLAINVPYFGLSTELQYRVPPERIGELAVQPFGVGYGEAVAGDMRDTTITITARNRPITISSITIDNQRFQIIDTGTLPVTLEPGETRELTIRFTPTDSAFTFGTSTIESDACGGEKFYLTGGFPGIRAAAQTLRVVSPNGGEVFLAAGETVIEWEGVAPDDTVQLEYSLDGGAKWDLITRDATGLQHKWQVPLAASATCLMRVVQRTSAGQDGALHLAGHTGRIFAVDITRDGSLVATGGDDDTVTIWNALTGDPLYKLPGHPLTVNSVQFSPDGTQLLVGTGMPVSRLWDVASGAFIRDIASNFDILSVSRFRPDAQRIASVTYGGGIVISDPADGSDIFAFPAHTGRGFAVDYSPDGKLIASGAIDSVVKVWDAETGAQVHGLSGHPINVSTVEFSPDGSQIASGGFDKTIKLSDLASGALLMEAQDQYAISAVRFFPDGKRLLISRYGPDVNILDAATGDILRQLVGHKRAVLFSAVSGDGNRVVTGDFLGKAIVWDMARAPYQRDVSDSLWAIVIPDIEVADIDFGQVPLGRTKDSLLTPYICNNGDVPIDVRNILVSGDGSFGPVSGVPPFTLAPGQCVPVEFRFGPLAVRKYNETVSIATNGDTLQGIIKGEGIEGGLRVETALVDFGLVPVGTTKDIPSIVVLTNTGPDPIDVTLTEQRGPDVVQFSILNGGGAFTLGPNETRSMGLRFAPQMRGRTLGRIAFRYAATASPAIVMLYGEGICPDDIDATGDVLVPPVIEAYTGELATLPVVLRTPGNAPQGGANYTLVLRFNRTLLAPEDSAATDVQVDGERFLVYRGQWDGVSDTVVTLEFIAALGNAESTPITVESFVWNTGCGQGNSQAESEFRLLDLCRDGYSPRLFLDSGTFALKPAQPNPARAVAEIGFGLLEEGATQLYITDTRGNRVAMLVDDVMQPGEYRVKIDVAAYATGTYFYTLQTPTQQMTRRLEVRK